MSTAKLVTQTYQTKLWNQPHGIKNKYSQTKSQSVEWPHFENKTVLSLQTDPNRIWAWAH